MVIECNNKILLSRAQMKQTEAGRKAFMEKMDDVFEQLYQAGEDVVGYEKI
jgi:hypothetical protein